MGSLTKDHKIRVIVRKLKGKEREAAILRLLMYPELINAELYGAIKSFKRVRK